MSDENGNDSSQSEESSRKDVTIFDAKSDILTVRGTEEGLVLRIDGRADWSNILSDVQEFMGDKKKFLRGGQVAIEWLDRLPTKEQSLNLEQMLQDTYEVNLVAKKPKEPLKPVKAKVVERGGVTIPLFETAESSQAKADSSDGEIPELSPSEIMDFASGENEALGYMERMGRILGEEILYEDDSNCKVIFGTLRSGQRIETPFSLVVVGDVNPGADLIAGGDIVVMGSMRGTAHAAAYDEHATDRVIIALQMAPIQLRIGSVISRGSGEAGPEAEVARIEDRRIIVEPFNSRMNFGKKLRA